MPAQATFFPLSLAPELITRKPKGSSYDETILEVVHGCKGALILAGPDRKPVSIRSSIYARSKVLGVTVRVDFTKDGNVWVTPRDGNGKAAKEIVVKAAKEIVVKAPKKPKPSGKKKPRGR